MLHISDTPMGHESAHAAVVTEDHSQTAHLSLHTDFPKWTDEETEIRIVHELLHVRRRDYYRAQHMACEHLSPAVSDLVHECLTHEDEKDIDYLSKLLVELDQS